MIALKLKYIIVTKSLFRRRFEISDLRNHPDIIYLPLSCRLSNSYNNSMHERVLRQEAVNNKPSDQAYISLSGGLIFFQSALSVNTI